MTGTTRQHLDFYRIFCNVVNAHSGIIDDIWPKGDSAIHITFSEYISSDTLNDILSGSGWHITKYNPRITIIEPRYTNTYHLLARSVLFHVSDSNNRDSIHDNGLLPKEGGNTELHRSYPPRVYFATHILAAFEFIDFQCKKRPTPIKDGKVGPEPKMRKPDELDLYKVRVPEGIKFYTDSFFMARRYGASLGSINSVSSVLETGSSFELKSKNL